MFITQTDSTNRWLKDHLPQEDGFFIATDYQTAGRGQVGNTWESEQGQNLLVSILIRPKALKAQKQFRLSMIASLSVVEAVEGCTMHAQRADARCTMHGAQWTIKWPNDIYYGEKKVGGILIENQLSGGMVSDSIFGLGLNINQTDFKSDAPNPISLRQITGREIDRQEVLEGILTRLNELKEWLDDEHYEALKERYLRHLFRREGEHEYEDEGGRFTARFVDVDEAGRLVLGVKAERVKAYLFKQIKYIIKQ